MRNKDLNMETVLSPAFLKIWDNSLMGVMIIDAQGVFHYMNRLLIRTDDLQDEEIIGKKMVDFYPLERDCHLSIQTLEAGKPIVKKTMIYYTRKKKLVNSLCTSFPLISDGLVEGVIHFSLNLQTSQALLEKHQETSDGNSIVLPEHQPYTFDTLIGKDHKFQNTVTQAKSASQSPFNVFIWAETGCGKELFSQSIHQASPRSTRSFIPINCAAIPDNLLETTLFGTSKGAFTGAINKAGLLEEAQGGTILFDELNSMSLELQAKLLRVIQEKKVRRVGALKEISVDVTFISTINVPPAQALDTGKIREDLFYRLAVVVLEIPPLRRRKSDIPLLCAHFLDHLSLSTQTRQAMPPYTLSPAVYDIFNNYPWPGNVRELEHTIKAATAVLGFPGMIEPEHLSAYFIDNYEKASTRMDNAVQTNDSLSDNSRPGNPATPFFELLDQGTLDLGNTLKSIESICIQKALTRSGYNISKAGRFLHLSPQALRYKIKKLGLPIFHE
jgi:arginine utilization regulatory protein